MATPLYVAVAVSVALPFGPPAETPTMRSGFVPVPTVCDHESVLQDAQEVPADEGPTASSETVPLPPPPPPDVFETVTVMFAETPTLPAASYALVERVCEPFDTEAVFQEKLYGLVVSVLWSAPST
jgi:hypothetical protein